VNEDAVTIQKILTATWKIIKGLMCRNLIIQLLELRVLTIKGLLTQGNGQKIPDKTPPDENPPEVGQKLSVNL